MKNMKDTFPPIQPECIVSAAIRKVDDAVQIIMGVRHFDMFMRNQIDSKNFCLWEQGFMTNKFRFVSREEAWKIAKEQKQLCWGQNRPDGPLFSEDLY